MKNKRLRGCLRVLAFLLYFISVLIVCFVCAMVDSGTGLDSFIFTLNAGLDGTNPMTVINTAIDYIPHALFLLSLVIIPLILVRVCLKRLDVTLTVRSKRLRINSLLTALVILLETVGGPCMAFAALDKKLLLSQYLSNETTAIYEERYAPPSSVTVSAPEKRKNLVFIWLESMENTYMDRAHGGQQAENLIPNLTRLAEENVSFGGMQAVPYAQYTFGAMFAAGCGTPYAFSIRKNIAPKGPIAPKVPFLWDVLHEAGYYSEYLMGSDSAFAGTSNMLLSHGFDRIYDLNTAYDDGFVEKGYYKNWGLEDEKVFEIARRELTRLSEGDAPFCFMFSTMDTHFPVGYRCPQCRHEHKLRDESSSDTADIISCQDRQVCAFIEWLKTQDCYDDTVVYIMGDHPRMDKYLVSGIAYTERTLYNCLINSGLTPVSTDRCCTQFDVYPTVLSALGFEIEGGRLGFGTDLTGALPTLPEQLGYERFQAELRKRSAFFYEYIL